MGRSTAIALSYRDCRVKLGYDIFGDYDLELDSCSACRCKNLCEYLWWRL